MADFRFDIHAFDDSARQGTARYGTVTTPHGTFDTPAFMPVGTQGCLKGLTPDMVRDTGAQCILANTYHLMLRPTAEVVAELGGVQRFGAWNGPMLTDSGGFQVFSMADISDRDDDGVTFRSHLNGDRVRLTPERSMQVQNLLGADIIMAFDECPDSTADRGVQETALERTLRWAQRCIDAHQRPDQALFGIVQGGLHRDLRLHCAAELSKLDLPGYAVGGLAVGEGYDAMVGVLDYTCDALPAEKPRYLMGVGYPRDIVAAVTRGIDMFDCVLPTRNGRSCTAFTANGVVKLRHARHKADTGPIEPGCDCYACTHFSRGAIRHFSHAGEMLGPMLVSLHNVRFYQQLMADLRRAIADGMLGAFLEHDPRTHIGPAADSPDVSIATAPNDAPE
ncbi:MAG: tRNA guanosine(34) transglycosylase Tgt [Planctomycetota bacterium]